MAMEYSTGYSYVLNAWNRWIDAKQSSFLLLYHGTKKHIPFSQSLNQYSKMQWSRLMSFYELFLEGQKFIVRRCEGDQNCAFFLFYWVIFGGCFQAFQSFLDYSQEPLGDTYYGTFGRSLDAQSKNRDCGYQQNLQRT